MENKPQQTQYCNCSATGGTGLICSICHKPVTFDKPQLSAEMERKFEELMTELLYADMPGLQKENTPESFRKAAEKTFRKRLTPIIKHFLATALEEQKDEQSKIFKSILTKVLSFKTSPSLITAIIEDVTYEYNILNKKEAK